jgi:hypothetical protein
MVAFAAGTARAQPLDHLQCYKISDPHKFRGVVNLDSPQFGLTGGCKIKIRGTKLCAPTTKQLVSFDPDTPLVAFTSEDLVFDRICYRVKCPNAAIPPQEVTDQFGTRTVSIRSSVVEVCTPAVKGPAPVPSCGNAIVEPGEECESPLDCTGGAGCSPSCTCQCAFADPQCPSVMELTALARTGAEITATEEDWGTTGLAHDSDVVDGSRLALGITCGGSGPAACSQCEILGLDTDAGNCRCANDNRTQCDQPFMADGDDCGGATCECYLAPPTPRSNGNTPVCLVSRISASPNGTWNVDNGQGAIDLSVGRRVYLGDTLVEPCPSCEGDITANDGVRDGVCARGANDGASCDANGSDATFPAPGGGESSYDCFPSLGKLVSAPSGLAIDLTLSTGASSLTAAVDCGFAPDFPDTCHCGTCSGDDTRPCTSDAECAVLALGTCETPNITFADACQSPGDCSDAGGGEGECSSGPTDLSCDGVVRANGDGFVSCQTNVDCDPINIGIDAGDCTLAKTRECFLPTIQAQGSASTSQPVLAAIGCSARASSAGVNTVIGLPGPLRVRLEAETVFRCAGNPAFTYPGCP